MTRSIRYLLRAVPALTGSAPPFDPRAVPDDPVTLFLTWFDEALAAGVVEPHAMTLSTVDAEGRPDARTLILKDVDRLGWAFASPRSSAKGHQLAVHPSAALSFWWPSQVRAVRVRGPVLQGTEAESAADLAARSAAARDGVTEGDWALWRVVPERIEFWQGSADRRHLRLVYERQGDGWSHAVLSGEPREDAG
ncbi:pyridoxamine 5'-phosphate oxidase family protein [Microbacterium sp. KUDC0406]|uniref:pyridoxine/pyridoxamine 5'-phosphate oxidase n=1 Tax=Microbacterium sp. KUDC0406 TaxID=2909588 RepID=UPI001F2B4E95|nr:pyridoxamine 5'-phosphate oxidase family protein [Microbacterium sp. KUDC0406]UJP11108.1 pyridoxamine 5'-phosphate oxidase family protein [Microbacterium sp. KUDC0406]